MDLKGFNSKEVFALVLFGILFLYSGTMLILGSIDFSSPKITGHATEGTTTSNVTISKYLSIEMSTNLTEGIQFGSVNTLPATDINATHNYDDGSDGTTMYINVSTDSNTAVDFCVKANADLTDPSTTDVILIGNESYSNSTITNATDPLLGEEVALTTDYVKAGFNVSAGTGEYYRFWLDVPAGTPSGTYNNSVLFKGVEISTAC